LNSKYRFSLSGLLTIGIFISQVFNKLENFDGVNSKSTFFSIKLGFGGMLEKYKHLFINNTNATLLDVTNNYIHTGFRSFERRWCTTDSFNCSVTYTYGVGEYSFFTLTLYL
jgi:hypothetical protein